MMPWDKIDWPAVGTGMLLTAILMFQGVKGLFEGKKPEPAPAKPNSIEGMGAWLDAKAIADLSEQLGMLNVNIVALKVTIDETRKTVKDGREVSDRVMQKQVEALAQFEATVKHTALLWQGNTEAAKEISDQADKLAHTLQTLAMELARGGGKH